MSGKARREREKYGTGGRNGMRKILAVLACLCLLAGPAAALGTEETAEEEAVFRLPEPAVLTAEEEARIRENRGIRKDPMLTTAFSIVEEGNPFQTRYNLLAGETVASRLTYGAPFFWGGRAENHVFAGEPGYVVEPAWQNSGVYYRAGTNYLYGFDCFGFVAWVWKKTQPAELPETSKLIYDRNILRFPGPSKEKGARYTDPEYGLEIGDLLVMEHPGRHIAMYVGTLRQYGYTAEEVPELAEELDTPLVMHCGVNASIANRFAYLLENGRPVYRYATVTDGGVCVSLLCDSVQSAPRHVFQQKQDTYYYLLPDNTWLTVLPLEDTTMTCWVRLRADRNTEEAETAGK